MPIDNKQKNILFWSLSVLTVLVGLFYVYLLSSNASLNILPIILETKNHTSPLRSSNTFAEDYSKNASFAHLTYHGDSSFTFKYKKSSHQQHAFAGVWFPLENINIDFNAYDAIVVGIKTDKTKRIPLNFTVQNKVTTYQYIRCFIEIEEDKNTYTLQFDDFFTPTSWYERNKIAQVNLPKPDFEKINTMSFESCGLLNPNIEDEYTITHLKLVKNLQLEYLITISVVCVLIGLYMFFLLDLFSKKKEVIHVPIKTVDYEFKEEEEIENQIVQFLSENYTNPNLTLTDLTKEFGKNTRDISLIIKDTTKMSFPKYINFLRIEEAKRILKSKKYQQISEVGYLVGFNSPSNFNRVFKEREGSSPKNFIKTIENQ